MENKKQNGVLGFIKNAWAKRYVKVITVITIVAIIVASVLGFNRYQLVQSVTVSYDQAQTLLQSQKNREDIKFNETETQKLEQFVTDLSAMKTNLDVNGLKQFPTELNQFRFDTENRVFDALVKNVDDTFSSFPTRAELTDEERKEFTLAALGLKQLVSDAKPSLDEYASGFSATSIEAINTQVNDFVTLYHRHTDNIAARVEAARIAAEEEAARIAAENTPTYSDGGSSDGGNDSGYYDGGDDDDYYTPPTGGGTGGSNPPASNPPVTNTPPWGSGTCKDHQNSTSCTTWG